MTEAARRREALNPYELRDRIVSLEGKVDDLISKVAGNTRSIGLLIEGLQANTDAIRSHTTAINAVLGKLNK